MGVDQPWRRFGGLEQTQILLNSYRDWLGAELIPRRDNMEEEAMALYTAPFVVVAHGVGVDPLLTYGNQVALKLWEMDPETLVKTPSRLTAEPGLQEERAKFMQQTARDGFARGYTGIRISRSGKRFRIIDATVWNLHEPQGNYVGQAAKFARWEWLSETLCS